MKALSTAATGMLAQQMNVDVISNNIANQSTTAFKRRRAEFQDLLYQSIERVGANSTAQGTVVPSGIQVGVGVKAAGVYRISSQGTLETTDNPLDLAIDGPGYFRVQTPDGEELYTRAGSFQIDEEGEIVTPEGFQILPGINIQQEARDVSVNQDGEVQVKLDGQVDPQVVGQIDLAIFPNEAGLEAIGSNLFRETQASGPATIAVPDTDGFGIIEQGFLERSNVDPVKEITNLIAAQRSYELNSRVITTADQMLNAVNQLR